MLQLIFSLQTFYPKLFSRNIFFERGKKNLYRIKTKIDISVNLDINVILTNTAMKDLSEAAGT